MAEITFFDKPQLVKKTPNYYGENIDYLSDFHYLYCVGKDDNKEDVYAAMSGNANDHTFEGKEDYSITVYNDDEGKCYTTDAQDSKTYYPLPQEMLDKLNAAAVEASKLMECEKLRASLYDTYKDDYEEGIELGSDLSLKNDIDKDTDPESHTAMSFDEWLERAYPDEGYFLGHIWGKMAKFLCENDPLINLDYIELFQKSISALFIMDAEFIEMVEGNPEQRVFEYVPCGDFYENMDEIISRSAHPDLLSEMCDKYKIPAKTFEEFDRKMPKNGNKSFYVYIIADITKETPEMHLEVDISLPNEVHTLTDIPLSAREQAFALKECNKVFKRDTGKNLEDVCRVDKSLIKE